MHNCNYCKKAFSAGFEGAEAYCSETCFEKWILLDWRIRAERLEELALREALEKPDQFELFDS